MTALEFYQKTQYKKDGDLTLRTAVSLISLNVTVFTALGTSLYLLFERTDMNSSFLNVIHSERSN